MNGRILIGGGFFTHEQIDFGQLLANDPTFTLTKLEEECLQFGLPRIDEDVVVVLGMKGLVRILMKQGMRPRQIISEIKKLFLKVVPRRIPLVVVDDFSLVQAKYYFRPLLKFFSKELNLKCYLLREYLRHKHYPDWVKSFSLPANSYRSYRLSPNEKDLEFFFHGNASNRKRGKITTKIKDTYGDKNNHLVVTYGGVKNYTDRLDRERYLRLMARSQFCLNFSGSGYDCYRYNEIASVGSIIINPRTPLVVRNDYKDMESSIRYSSFASLKRKYEIVRSSEYMLDDLIGRSIENFEAYHTSEIRAKEFFEVVEGAYRGSI